MKMAELAFIKLCKKTLENYCHFHSTWWPIVAAD